MTVDGMEEDRLPVGRAGFKPVGTRQACSVGSTPTLFRHRRRRHPRRPFDRPGRRPAHWSAQWPTQWPSRRYGRPTP